jgi:hypothetical protein
MTQSGHAFEVRLLSTVPPVRPGEARTVPSTARAAAEWPWSFVPSKAPPVVAAVERVRVSPADSQRFLARLGIGPAIAGVEPVFGSTIAPAETTARSHQPGE